MCSQTQTSDRSVHEECSTNTIRPGSMTFLYKTTTSSVRINYYRLGKGDPVVLLHGFASSSYTWLRVADVLAANHTVFAIDLKGFGLSEKPADRGYSPVDQAHIIRQFILNYDMKNLAIVGHSFGGAVALSTYNSLGQEKERVRAMVLLDAFIQNPILPLRMKLATTPLFNHLALRLLPAKFTAYVILRGSYSKNSTIAEETLQAYAHCIGLPGALHAMTESVGRFFYKNPDDLHKIASEIDIPVLVIWGEEDPVFPVSNGRPLVSRMLRGRLEVIPGCGHVPQEEKPVETATILTGFLGVHSGGHSQA